MQEGEVPEVVDQNDEVLEADKAEQPSPIQAQPQTSETPTVTTEQSVNSAPEQPQVSKESLVNRIMALDADLTAEGADIDTNRQALMEMSEEDLQTMFDAEQQKVLIDQIIRGDQELNESTPEFLQQYRDRLKNLPTEALQAMIEGQQNRLGSDGIGLERENLPSPDPTEEDLKLAFKEPVNAYELDERWLGKDGEGGIIRDVIKANYYGEFRQQVLAEEQQTQEISQQVQAEFIQEFVQQQGSTQEVGDTVVAPDLEEYLNQNQAKITAEIQSRIRQKIDERMKPLIEEKFQQALTEGNTAEEFFQIAANEPPDGVSEDSPGEEGNLSEEKKRKSRLKELFIQLVAKIGNFTAEGVMSSDFGQLLRFLLHNEASFSNSNYFEDNNLFENKKQVDDKQFKELVLKNKEAGESTFKAYNKVFTQVGEAYGYLANDEQKELLEDIDDSDHEKIKKKARILYDILYEQFVTNKNPDLISKVFARAFNESNGLKGSFGEDQIVNEKVLDLLYSFKDNVQYQNIMSET